MKRGSDFVFVDRAADLEAALPALRAARVLALDTESDSLYRYRERVCFLQIAVGSHAWLVDTIAIRDLECLRPVFEGPQLKVLHGADYDLSGLFRDFGLRLASVFDTMIAAQLLGREHLGLAALVREFFGAELDKTLTRHDWGTRPLEDKHVRYLVEDVVHLTGVHERLAAELARDDLVEEAEIEFARLLGSVAPRAPFDPEGFRHIRGAHTLTREGLSVLRELYLLRDRLSAQADKPPFKVLGNHQLLAIAETLPGDLDALREVTRLPPHLLRRLGPGLLRAVRSGHDNQANVPLRVKAKGSRPPEIKVAWIDTLKVWRREAAVRDGRTTMAILPNHLLHALADVRPATIAEIGAVPLFGKRRLERYGEAILDATRALAACGVDPAGGPSRLPDDG
jgi:ribonuclease D